MTSGTVIDVFAEGAMMAADSAIVSTMFRLPFFSLLLSIFQPSCFMF
jgi:hypothetical protein